MILRLFLVWLTSTCPLTTISSAAVYLLCTATYVCMPCNWFLQLMARVKNLQKLVVHRTTTRSCLCILRGAIKNLKTTSVCPFCVCQMLNHLGFLVTPFCTHMWYWYELECMTKVCAHSCVCWLVRLVFVRQIFAVNDKRSYKRKPRNEYITLQTMR